jgi:drug/metabolite transporter (DMT)-like permease
MKQSLDIEESPKQRFINTQNENKSILMQIIDYFTDDRERTERQKLSVALISNICFTLVNFFAKTISYNYPKPDVLSILFYRSVATFFCAFAYYKYMKLKLFDLRKLEIPIPFIIFNVALIGIAYAIPKSVIYIRLGTANAFTSVAPVAACIFSVLFMKDKCYLRYIIGLSGCLFAMYLLTFFGEGDSENNSDLFLGIFWSSVGLVSRTSIIIVVKMLATKIDSASLVLYMGVVGTIFSFCMIIIFGNLYFNPVFIFLSACSGISYWLGAFFHNYAMKMNSINTVSFIEYLSLVYGFLLGIIFFGESIKFTDIIGCMIIVGYSLYSFLYPIENK